MTRRQMVMVEIDAELKGHRSRMRRLLKQLAQPQAVRCTALTVRPRMTVMRAPADIPVGRQRLGTPQRLLQAAAR